MDITRHMTCIYVMLALFQLWKSLGWIALKPGSRPHLLPPTAKHSCTHSVAVPGMPLTWQIPRVASAIVGCSEQHKYTEACETICSNVLCYFQLLCQNHLQIWVVEQMPVSKLEVVGHDEPAAWNVYGKPRKIEESTLGLKLNRDDYVPQTNWKKLNTTDQRGRSTWTPWPQIPYPQISQGLPSKMVPPGCRTITPCDT